MGLLSGFPTFTGSSKPLVADLRTAFRKILEQLGGVYDGVQYPGNLQVVNHVAAPEFRNDQKADPSSIFTLTAFARYAHPVVKARLVAPLDFRLKGITFGFIFPWTEQGSANPTGYFTLRDLGRGLELAHEEPKPYVGPTLGYGLPIVKIEASSPMDLYISAGTLLELEMQDAGDSTNISGAQLNATFFCQAEHQKP